MPCLLLSFVLVQKDGTVMVNSSHRGLPYTLHLGRGTNSGVCQIYVKYERNVYIMKEK